MRLAGRILLVTALVCLVSACAVNAQSVRDDAETTVVETAYHIVPSYGGKFKVGVAVVAANPYEDKFASRPTVRVTLRAADGSVITTREVSSAGIPPKQRIAFCEELYADEMPAKVDFRPLGAGYEATAYRASDFLPFELVGVRARDDGGRLRVTGEIKNPYPGETGRGSRSCSGIRPGSYSGGIRSTNRRSPRATPRRLRRTSRPTRSRP